MLSSEAFMQTPHSLPNKSIALQRLVILHMFRELAQWIRCRRALGATKEGHGFYAKGDNLRAV